MGRVAHFEHADGRAATVEVLVTALLPSAQDLVDWHINVYSSTDFKTGLCAEELSRHANLLYRIVEVGRRGALFSQSTMLDAVTRVVSDAQLDHALIRNTLGLGKGMDEVLNLISYKLRVMCAHVRNKFDAHVPGADATPELQRIFARLQMHGERQSEKSRRQERLSQRPNPFKHYQVPAAEDGEGEDIAYDDLEVVSTYWDGRRAVALRADGST